jgi:hypothetical protein
MWWFSFFLGNSPCMFPWGTFQWIFPKKNKKNKKKIRCFAPLCVSLLIVKQLRKFHLSNLF